MHLASKTQRYGCAWILLSFLYHHETVSPRTARALRYVVREEVGDLFGIRLAIWDSRGYPIAELGILTRNGQILIFQSITTLSQS
jgi:hypothetical protein